MSADKLAALRARITAEFEKARQNHGVVSRYGSEPVSALDDAIDELLRSKDAGTKTRTRPVPSHRTTSFGRQVSYDLGELPREDSTVLAKKLFEQALRRHDENRKTRS